MQRLSRDLRDGRIVSDQKFDLIFPLKARTFSSIHWTPVEVALKAGEWLRKYGRGGRVLDVGSGCGKFCLVASHAYASGTFIGFEQRGELVETANRLRDLFQLTNVEFQQTDASLEDWSAFEAIYFFNPYYENILPSIQMGDGIKYSEEKYRLFIARTEEKMRALPKGTLVLTYHGFGGDLPNEFEQLENEFVGSSYLELWKKSS